MGGWPSFWASLERGRPPLLLAALLVFVPLALALAQDRIEGIDLSHGEGIEAPAAAFRIVGPLPADTPYQVAAAHIEAGQDRPSDGKVLSFGVSWNKFWAVADLNNASPDPGTWQIRTPLNDAGELELLILREGRPPEPILAASFRQGFNTRPVDSRKLISAPFELAPGETAKLALGYRPLGFSDLPLWVAPPEQMQSWTADLSRSDAVFYTGVGVVLICFLGFCLAIRNWTGVWFAGFMVLNLAVVAQLEGQFFRYLWPNAPLFNLNATLPVMLLAAGFGYLTTLIAGRRSDQPRLSLAIKIALGATILLLAATPFAHPTLVMPGAFALWFGTFAAFALSLPGWAEFSRTQRRVGQVLSGAVLLSACLFILATLSVGSAGWLSADWTIRLSYLIGSGGLLCLLLMQVSRLFQAHQASLKAQLVAAQKEADLNASLLKSERAYADAVSRAVKTQQRLAAASHDIQQPLSALRLLLKQEVAALPGGTIDGAMDYLDRMAGSFADEDTEPASETEVESYDLTMVLKAAADMFRDEAEQHGITLRLETAAPLMTTVPTLDLMRIVSNLTVNAIRHSNGSEVTLAVSKMPEGATISVTNDGVALTPADFETFLERGERGSGSTGDGLGLAIIAELCNAHGLKLELDEDLKRGTRLQVCLPSIVA